MDTSETYIKMCVKAGEIQKLDKNEEENFYEYSPYPNCNGHHMPVWLPRQDQLQEMLPDVGTWTDHNRALAQCFANFCNPTFVTGKEEMNECKRDKKAKKQWGTRYVKVLSAQENISQFTSMEQLWLAFVMKEKFGKIWNGEEWVNANLGR